MERYRICCICDCLMREGYVIESCDCYCSRECLHQRTSEAEYEVLYQNGEGDSYWTEW